MSDRLAPPEMSAFPTVESEQASSSGEIVIYSTAWCGDCRRAKRIFAASGVPYREIDIEEHPNAAQLVQRVNNGFLSVPTILFPDGSALVEPGNAELQAKLAPYVRLSR
jgi:mycoredoxin